MSIREWASSSVAIERIWTLVDTPSRDELICLQRACIHSLVTEPPGFLHLGSNRQLARCRNPPWHAGIFTMLGASNMYYGWQKYPYLLRWRRRSLQDSNPSTYHQGVCVSHFNLRECSRTRSGSASSTLLTNTGSAWRRTLPHFDGGPGLSSISLI